MPYYSIEKIKVGSFPDGKAWGGYIFGANMSLGFDDKPAQLILNIINETGVYTISKTDLTFESDVTIKIGRVGNPFEIKMFPIKYELNKNGEQKSLMVTYVDRSKILDRVFVGRLNEHTRRNVQTVALTAAVPIACPSCDGSSLDRRFNFTATRQADTLGFSGNQSSLQFKKVGFTVRTDSYSDAATNKLSYHFSKSDPNFDENNPTYQFLADQQIPITSFAADATISSNVGTLNLDEFVSARVHGYFKYVIVPTTIPVQGYISGNVTNGGFIGIGTEEFSQSSCASAPVSYSLKELKTLIRTFGIGIAAQTIGANTVDTIPDGIEQIRKTYSGTLRAVLLQWGAEYGFSFTYDFTSHTIIGIDRRNPILSLSSIKTAVSSADSLSDIDASPIVESLTEEVSIEDTSKNYHVTAYKRDQKIKKFTGKIHNRAFFVRLRLSDVMLLPFGFSNFDQLYVACIIAKVLGREAWEAYLKQEGVYNLLSGVIANSSIGNQEKLKYLNLSFSAYETVRAVGKKLDFLGEIYQTQAGMADFINSFYYNTAFNPRSSRCCEGQLAGSLDALATSKNDIDAQFDEKVETFYATNWQQPACFTSISTSYATFSQAVPSYYRLFGKYTSLLKGVGDVVLGIFGSALFPSFSVFDRTSHYFVSANFQDINASDQKKVYTFTNSDATSLIGQHINVVVSSLTMNAVTLTFDSQVNPNESIKPGEFSSNDCKIRCEESIVSQACDPDKCATEIYQRTDRAWQKGLFDSVGDLITINLNPTALGVSPTQIRIVSPSNSNYQCNFIRSVNTSYIIPGAKRVLDRFDTLPGNVGTVSSTVNDVTSDLDPYLDSGGTVITNIFVPKEINGKNVVTVEEYDAQIRLDNALVEASLTSPTERFTFTVPGVLDHDSILSAGQSILYAQKGLTNISIQFTDKGVSSSYSFSTRPPTPIPQFSLRTWDKIGAKFII